MASGILSKPPSGYTRVSPGVYRNSAGKTRKAGQSAPSSSSRTPTGNGKLNDKYAGQTGGMNKIINQNISNDAGVSGVAGNMMGQIQQQYGSGQGPDYSGVQGLGSKQDFEAWKQEAMDSANKAFSQYNEPVFDKQLRQLHQELANRGIPEGSDAYNSEMGQLQAQQNMARNQAQNSAFQTASGNAANMAATNISLNQTGRGNAQQDYYQPLDVYTKLQGAQSGAAQTGLSAAEQYGQQQKQIEAQKWAATHGGGGGTNPANWNNTGMTWQQAQDYQAQLANNAAKNQARANAPSTGSQLLNIGTSILGPFAGSQKGSELISQGLGYFF